MKRFLIFLAGLILCGISPVFGQKAVSFEIEADDSPHDGGRLYITTAGDRRMISGAALEAWLVSDGEKVVFSGADGAGGYENEGQSLRIYDVRTGRARKIMSQYYMITGLSEFRLKNGRRALLVRMEDGGLGGSYFSVVDPGRGEVFFRRWAEITELRNDTITLAFYRESDWETINQSRDESFYLNKNAFPGQKPPVRPYRTEMHDLKKILRRPLLVNRPTFEYLDANLKRVKIYLWRAGGRDFVLEPVEREVSSATPLGGALAELFIGAYPDDRQKGLNSPTFGMKFEGVVLKAGVATVKVSQPPGTANDGARDAFIFLAAVEKTARQFPSVKRVEICAVGDISIDAPLEKKLPRCD